MGSRILVVEDEPTMRRVLSLVLTGAGHEVAEAESGEQAVEEMNRGGVVAVALVDKNLPGMSGIEFIRKLRERSNKSHAIMITAFASLQSLEEAREAGAVAYLLKPIDSLETITTLVDHAIRDGAESPTLKALFDGAIDQLRRASDPASAPQRSA